MRFTSEVFGSTMCGTYEGKSNSVPSFGGILKYVPLNAFVVTFSYEKSLCVHQSIFVGLYITKSPDPSGVDNQNTPDMMDSGCVCGVFH